MVATWMNVARRKRDASSDSLLRRQVFLPHPRSDLFRFPSPRKAKKKKINNNMKEEVSADDVEEFVNSHECEKEKEAN